eukprot:Plantae.Rhodophyta-Hildenbrandia_rubra.ctg14867.p1 GENE.Plantae.Rhodophyta-Hildenbrandia_rubra.ctg14867~~Plantae.Rhodophyta-Hildenbrandia_rubra.ctg14867.p1  ORF type:complete len:476 (-),score=75.16 Plantae.Rhodophyta-Hildenbrandia_rubra.ctg14867:877-2304(-)
MIVGFAGAWQLAATPTIFQNGRRIRLSYKLLVNGGHKRWGMNSSASNALLWLNPASNKERRSANFMCLQSSRTESKQALQNIVFEESRKSPVAVLYQQLPPPELDGIRKPRKPNGYSDSGADIAHALRQSGQTVITPVSDPQDGVDYHWVFPDTSKGINDAISLGAKTLWANTILFKGHPIESVDDNVLVVGQIPERAEKFDDKWVANKFFRDNGLPVAKSMLVSDESQTDGINVDMLTLERLEEEGLTSPWIIKPVRGRGSQGVMKVDSFDILKEKIKKSFAEVYQIDGQTYSSYGFKFMVEEFLCNEEVTITVLPPGRYNIKGDKTRKEKHWSLPVIERFDHEDGIAPYSGAKAVVTNSYVLPEEKRLGADYLELSKQCEKAAELIGAVAPIRIDCRRNAQGKFRMFDLNLKPNMTGSIRPGRSDQDGLAALAARGVGWSYADMISNILYQAQTNKARREATSAIPDRAQKRH